MMDSVGLADYQRYDVRNVLKENNKQAGGKMTRVVTND